MKKQALFLLLLAVLGIGQVSAQSTKEADVTRLMSYNVRNGKGLDDVTNYERIAQVIIDNQADIVALQELDSVTNRSGKKDVLQEIASRAGMYGVYAPAIDYDGGKYGIGLMSKQQPLSVSRYALPGREEARALLLVEFDDYIVGCTHLSLTEEDRMLSLAKFRELAQTAAKPLIIAGDLNAEPDSDFIAQLRQDFTILSALDAPTFPANKPDKTIDYIFVTTPAAMSHLPGVVVDEPVASDHRPLYVDLKTSN